MNNMITERHNFRPRTQMPINRISKHALNVRTAGITACRIILDECVEHGEKGSVREIIASMNYSVRSCEKELQRRSRAS